VSGWQDAGSVLARATDPDQFACEYPDCARSFTSEQGLKHHKTSAGHHAAEGGASLK
jgi:hypothetical protein